MGLVQSSQTKKKSVVIVRVQNEKGKISSVVKVGTYINVSPKNTPQTSESGKSFFGDAKFDSLTAVLLGGFAFNGVGYDPTIETGKPAIQENGTKLILQSSSFLSHVFPFLLSISFKELQDRSSHDTIASQELSLLVEMLNLELTVIDSLKISITDLKKQVQLNKTGVLYTTDPKSNSMRFSLIKGNPRKKNRQATLAVGELHLKDTIFCKNKKNASLWNGVAILKGPLKENEPQIVFCLFLEVMLQESPISPQKAKPKCCCGCSWCYQGFYASVKDAVVLPMSDADFESRSPLQCTPPYSNITQHVPGVRERARAFELLCNIQAKFSTHAAVWLHKQEHSIVIAFQGTSPTDLFDQFFKTDCDYAQEPYEEMAVLDGNAHKKILSPNVHSGFNNAMNEVLATLHFVVDYTMQFSDAREGRTTLSNDWKVYVTGYSLGAALSTLASYDLANYYQHHPFEIFVYNFGSPPIGDANFAAAFSKRDNICAFYRIVNQHDIVPHIFPSKGLFSLVCPRYVHVGKLVVLLGESEYKCSNGGAVWIEGESLSTCPNLIVDDLTNRPKNKQSVINKMPDADPNMFLSHLYQAYYDSLERCVLKNFDQL